MIMHGDCPSIWCLVVFIQTIIPSIRQMTFGGLGIVFSSVIPLDVPPETTDIWRTAVAFGAECYKELNPRITHVVANKVSYLDTSFKLMEGLIVLLLFLVERYGKGRPSSTTSTDHKSFDQGGLASMVQRFSGALEATR